MKKGNSTKKVSINSLSGANQIDNLNEIKVNNSDKMNIALVVIATLIFVFGGYILFFKNKNGSSTAIDNGIYGDAIEFRRIAIGEYGELYLDVDGRAYYVLPENIEKVHDMSSFVRVFRTVKNEIYSAEKIEAILLNITGVERINYGIDSDGGKYILTVRDGKQYYLNDEDITQGIIKLVYAETYNNAIDAVVTFFATKAGNNAATVSALLQDDDTETPPIEITTDYTNGREIIRINSDGTWTFIDRNGRETKLTEDDPIVKEFREDYKEKNHGNEYVPPVAIPPKEGVLLQGESRVSDELLEKYDKKEYTQRDIKRYNSQIASCSCGYYNGLEDTYEGQTICRDYAGYVCRTEDGHFVNPTLGVKVENGIPTSIYIDYSKYAAAKEEQSSRDINQAKKDGFDRIWEIDRYGKLTVSKISTAERKFEPCYEANADEYDKCIKDVYRHNSEVTSTSLTCLGSYTVCKKLALDNMKKLGYSEADIDSIYSIGHATDMVNAMEERALLLSKIARGEIEDRRPTDEQTSTAPEKNSIFKDDAVKRLMNEKNLSEEKAREIVDATYKKFGEITGSSPEEILKKYDEFYQQVLDNSKGAATSNQTQSGSTNNTGSTTQGSSNNTGSTTQSSKPEGAVPPVVGSKGLECPAGTTRCGNGNWCCDINSSSGSTNSGSDISLCIDRCVKSGGPEAGCRTDCLKSNSGSTPTPQPTSTTNANTNPTPTPNQKPEPTPKPTPESTPEPEPTPKATPYSSCVISCKQGGGPNCEKDCTPKS